MNILSFISPILLYRNMTKRNSMIEVREVAGRRRLYIDGYPQSQIAYRRDWKTILKKAAIGRLPRGARILVLGLGGGDVVKLLKNYQSEATIAAVELEREVVTVAREYFGISAGPKLKIVVADAKKYMAANNTNYDLVVVDLYNGDDVPALVTSETFLDHVANALSNKGKAIFNYASHDFIPKDFAEFEQKLHVSFRYVTQLKTWGHTYYLVSMV